MDRCQSGEGLAWFGKTCSDTWRLVGDDPDLSLLADGNEGGLPQA